MQRDLAHLVLRIEMCLRACEAALVRLDGFGLPIGLVVVVLVLVDLARRNILMLGLGRGIVWRDIGGCRWIVSICVARVRAVIVVRLLAIRHRGQNTSRFAGMNEREENVRLKE